MTLESLFEQEFSPIEIIVVDDGSTDDTSALLERWKDRVKVFSQANLGPGAARNLGASKATGQYLAFIDSDDVWFPWSATAYSEAIGSNAAPSFVAGRPFRFSSGRAPLVTHETLSTLYFDDYLASGDNWRWWGASSFVVSADAMRAAGGFVTKNINGEDADLALRLGVEKGFVQITAPYTFGYREHELSVMSDFLKTLAGAWHLVHCERSGKYPGRSERKRERLIILSRHVRPVSIECVKRGYRGDAWRLYKATFGWNARLHRWKYLCAFPAVLATSSVPRRRSTSELQGRS